MMNEGSLLYIDRNMIANFWAAEHAREILLAQPYRCAILEEPSIVPLLLWSAKGSEEEQTEREEVSIASLTQSGVLEAHQLQREHHVQTYIRFAQLISDKQAALFTLVVTQGALLASDDQRTRRIFRQFFPDISIMSTLTFFHTWQKHDHVDDTDLRKIGQIVEQRTQFLPPKDDPLLPWWRHLIK
jgi:hypothetical protein